MPLPFVKLRKADIGLEGLPVLLQEYVRGLRYERGFFSGTLDCLASGLSQWDGLVCSETSQGSEVNFDQSKGQEEDPRKAS